jgi:hypothetical protein
VYLEGIELRRYTDIQSILHVQTHILLAIGIGDWYLPAVGEEVDCTHLAEHLIADLEYLAEGGLNVAGIL